MTSSAILLVLLSCATHALWNLLSKRSSNTPAFFLVSNLSCLALAPVFVALGGLDLVRMAPPSLWACLAATGVCQGAYFAFLALAYRHGDISVVYPLARALPILMVTVVALGLGQWPTPLAVLGIALVVGGCLVLPLHRLEARTEGYPIRRYLNRGCMWAALTALGSAGYTVLDDIAMDLVVGIESLPLLGITAALLYASLEWVATSIVLLVIVLLGGGAGEIRRVWREEKGTSLLVGAMAYGTYVLILWAYVLSEKVAYVAGFRQLSIVFGVILGIWVLGERGGPVRIAASLVIVSGLILIGLAE